MDRANCGFDYRNIFNTAIVAATRFKLDGWKSVMVNGWQIAPLMRLISGAPLTVTSGIDNSLTGIGNDRPNLVSSGNIYTRSTITSSDAPVFERLRVRAESDRQLWKRGT